MCSLLMIFLFIILYWFCIIGCSLCWIVGDWLCCNCCGVLIFVCWCWVGNGVCVMVMM